MHNPFLEYDALPRYDAINPALAGEAVVLTLTSSKPS